jgi:hypothetical protein
VALDAETKVEAIVLRAGRVTCDGAQKGRCPCDEDGEINRKDWDRDHGPPKGRWKS